MGQLISTSTCRTYLQLNDLYQRAREEYRQNDRHRLAHEASGRRLEESCCHKCRRLKQLHRRKNRGGCIEQTQTRFAEEQDEQWGLNSHRCRRRERTRYTNER